jgi:putative Mg2+ transporter-C (MgtC) family protein
VRLAVTWSEIAVRLLSALAAGILIGLNRSQRGRAAGLRTMTLVALAACVSMIQVNLLLPISGKASDSFAVMDLMRLPLGILSGMGFIGAGAILRRDDFVVGVTTATAMWFVTVLGLCFGGGQISLGLIGLGLGALVLAGLKLVEDRIQQARVCKLAIMTEPSGPTETEIRALLTASGLRITSSAVSILRGKAERELNLSVRWRAKEAETRVPEAVNELARHSGVIRIAWSPRPS